MYEFHDYFSNKKSSQVEVILYDIGSARNILSLLQSAKKLRNISKGYDIIHAQYGSVIGLMVGLSLIKTNQVKIVTIRGSDWYFLKYRDIRYRIHSFIATKVTKLALGLFDCTFVVSKALAREVKMYSRKTCVITTPVDFERFYIKNKDKVRSMYNMDKVKKYVLFASITLDSEIKRFNLLEEAVAILNQDKKKYIEIVTAVEFDHNEMCDIYNSVDIICLPSTHEGWPNVIKEALACGTPFVATNVSDLNEISLLSKGLCLISSDNSVDLAKNIAVALSKTISIREREFLRETIMRICDIDSVANKISEEYKNTISNHQC